MRYAQKDTSGELVEATETAPRFRNYICPTCRSRVWLRRGLIRDPYFAHRANEGSPDCEDYYPGGGASTRPKSSSVRREGEASPAEAGLCLNDAEGAWNTYLRLPEIPAQELATVSSGALRHAHVEIRADGDLIETLPALELWPGVGSARVCVPPSSKPYQIEPMGEWPKGVNAQRWHAVSVGLSEMGTLFRFSRGEWVRLRLASLVEWGDFLCCVGNSRMVPPTSCTPFLVKGLIQNWSLWHLQLPPEPGLIAERWLRSLGHDVSLPEPHLQIMTVPNAVDPTTRVPSFEHGVPIVAKVVTGNREEKPLVTLSFESNTFSTTSRFGPESGESFFEISAGRLGAYSLEINGEHKSGGMFECVGPGTIEQLRNTLADAPRLRMSIGETSFVAWTDYSSTLTTKSSTVVPDVHIDLGLGQGRLNLLLYSNNVRLVRTQISPREAERIIQGEISRRMPFQLQVDAGAFGSLMLNIDTTLKCEKVRPVNRIAAWVVGASAESGAPAIGRSRAMVESSELLVASIHNPTPALATQLRAAAKRIRHRGPRSSQ